MIEGFPLNPLQLYVFLYALEGRCKFNKDEWKCSDREYEYAREILESMGIPPIDQKKVLEICKEHGGRCDSEILMNASPFLLGEEST